MLFDWMTVARNGGNLFKSSDWWTQRGGDEDRNSFFLSTETSPNKWITLLKLHVHLFIVKKILKKIAGLREFALPC
jgi:hypothetical protein